MGNENKNGEGTDPFLWITDLCQDSASTTRKSPVNPVTFFGKPGSDDLSSDSDSDSESDSDNPPHPDIGMVSPPDTLPTNDATAVLENNIHISPEPTSNSINGRTDAVGVGADNGRNGSNSRAINQGRRALPSWANERGQAEAQAQPSLNDGFGGISFQELLKSLEKKNEEDMELESLSLLEVAEKYWGPLGS